MSIKERGSEARKWRQARMPVVHVRRLSRTIGSPFWPGQPGAEFQQELQPLDSEHVVEKHVPDAFVHSGLERWLRVRDIHALLVVGVSTNNSVDEGGWRSAGACEPAISPARDRADISEPQGEISKVSSATSSPSALSACTECDDDVPEKLRSVLI